MPTPDKSSPQTAAPPQTNDKLSENRERPQSDKPKTQTTKEERQAEQIKWKLRDLGVASRVTVFLNNGNERYGSIERIDDNTFQLAEVDIKQIVTISYSEVKKIRAGYGNPNQFTGKRWNPIWAKISVAALIIMFAVIVPLSIPRT